MTKLYELTEQFKELSTLSDCEDMKEALADTLEGIQGEFRDKAQAITGMALNMDADTYAIDEEIKRLTARKKTIQNRQQSIKDYLRVNMDRCDIKKISCPLFTITCVQGRNLVYIDNQDALPEEYLSVKTVIAPDKKAIEAVLKEGLEVPGAHFEKSKSSIRIK